MLQPAPRSLTIQFNSIQFNNAGKAPESFMHIKHFSLTAELFIFFFFFSLETPLFCYYFQTKQSNVMKLLVIFQNGGSSDENVLFSFGFCSPRPPHRSGCNQKAPPATWGILVLWLCTQQLMAVQDLISMQFLFWIFYFSLWQLQRGEVKNNEELPSLVFQQLLLPCSRFAVNWTVHCYQSCLLPNLSTGLWWSLPEEPLLSSAAQTGWACPALELSWKTLPAPRAPTPAGLPREPLPGKVLPEDKHCTEMVSLYLSPSQTRTSLWSHPSVIALWILFQFLVSVHCANRTWLPKHSILCSCSRLWRLNTPQVQQILNMSEAL